MPLVSPHWSIDSLTHSFQELSREEKNEEFELDVSAPYDSIHMINALEQKQQQQQHQQQHNGITGKAYKPREDTKFVYDNDSMFMNDNNTQPVSHPHWS